MPLLSVIVPVYNVEAYLEECLDSLLVQSFPDFEVILVNDGSSDNSLHICESFHQRFPKRFRLFSQANGGLSAARNLGISHALGDWLCFVDSDDWVSHDFLEKLLSTAHVEQAEIVACGYRAHYQDGRTEDFLASDKSAADIRRQVLLGQTFACNKMFARSLFTPDDAKFVEGICYEDLGTIPLLVARAKKVFAIDAPLYHYRIGRPGAITTFRDEKILDIFISLRRLLKLMPEEFYPELEWMAIRACVFRYFMVAPFPKGRVFQKQIKNFLEVSFENWRKNIYLKNERNWRFRLKVKLLAWNLGWLSLR
jgi:glycosyltransferase involved in cell wall biosynthesis